MASILLIFLFAAVSIDASDQHVEQEIQQRLAGTLDELTSRKDHYLGYPETPHDNELNQLLSPFQSFHLNNVGDPWEEGNWDLHTKQYEKEVIRFFSEMYHIEDDFWGYVTNGGTEGNLFGIYMAKKNLTSSLLLQISDPEVEVKVAAPILVSSQASHYSIAKAADLLGLRYYQIETSEYDEIDYEALENFVRDHTNDPLIFVLNLGTTMTGAIDSPSKIVGILRKYTDKFTIHVDGALHGMYYFFMENSEDLFDLGIQSISISGHKFIGTIQPCGIFITRKSLHETAFSQRGKISYIDVRDTPISGSRDGMQSLRLWVRLKQKGMNGLDDDYKKSITLAKYFVEQLARNDDEKIVYFPNQTIVAFSAPSLEIAKKHQLPIDTNGRTHVVFRPDMTVGQIERFLKDLAKRST